MQPDLDQTPDLDWSWSQSRSGCIIRIALNNATRPGLRRRLVQVKSGWGIIRMLHLDWNQYWNLTGAWAVSSERSPRGGAAARGLRAKGSLRKGPRAGVSPRKGLRAGVSPRVRGSPRGGLGAKVSARSSPRKGLRAGLSPRRGPAQKKSDDSAQAVRLLRPELSNCHCNLTIPAEVRFRRQAQWCLHSLAKNAICPGFPATLPKPPRVCTHVKGQCSNTVPELAC